ncbi:MAG: Lrp/AsnC family transcriptional regulator [Candidatus Woesearchaeota archaeon]
MNDLKKKDFEIIKHLRMNSRQTLTQISKKTHIPISTLYDKLRLYEKEAILKHTSIIDFDKLGYSTRTQIYLKTNLENRHKLQNFLLTHENINNMFLLTNDYDFCLDCVFEDSRSVRDFIDYLDNEFCIEKQQVLFVAKEIVAEKFLAS